MRISDHAETDSFFFSVRPQLSSSPEDTFNQPTAFHAGLDCTLIPHASPRSSVVVPAVQKIRASKKS